MYFLKTAKIVFNKIFFYFSMNIKVRFAPSPTGHLHIGGLRAALFNFYFAKQQSGKFVIRIEDTDHERNKEEYTQAILDSFAWCGIQSDEEILYQSKRQDVYAKYIERLLASGKAYYTDELDADGNLSRVIKCKVDKTRQEIAFTDIIRGTVTFPITEFEDFIIVRSDGTPLYNLVVVIDDIEMQISHVIRGEEHLTNTPKQIMLYEAFGVHIPFFAHLPLILGQDRKKLSKRDAATAVIDYKNEGIFSEALCMYLLRLGWAYKDQEIFTLDEIYRYFRLEDIHSAGAIFDNQKLLSVNRYFMKQKLVDELYSEMITLFSAQKEFIFDEVKDKKIIELYRDRTSTLKELALICTKIKKRPCFEGVEPALYKEFKSVISSMVDQKESLPDMTLLVREAERITGLTKHTVYMALRFALFGVVESPSILKLAALFSPEELIARFTHFLSFEDSLLRVK